MKNTLFLSEIYAAFISLVVVVRLFRFDSFASENTRSHIVASSLISFLSAFFRFLLFHFFFDISFSATKFIFQ